MAADAQQLPYALDPLVAEANRRKRRRRLLTGVLLAGILATGLLSYARLDHGPAPAPTAAVQADAILSNAGAQQSVHYASWEDAGDAGAVLTSGDVANGRGVLRLAMRGYTAHGTRDWGRATVVVIGRNVYVRGRASGLRLWLYLSRTQAARYAGRWISIRRGSQLYEVVAGGGTLESFLRQVTPHGRLKTSTSVVNGQRVVEITGTSWRGQTSLTAQSSSLLPLAAGYVAGAGKGATKISRWNEPVHVNAPRNSVPIATVRRG